MTDCKCTEPSYTIELNQQGPPGKQGFSPTITVDTYTDDSYILKITNETNEFLTPDLFLQREDYAKADFSNVDNPVTLNGSEFSTNGNTLLNTTINGIFQIKDPSNSSRILYVNEDSFNFNTQQGFNIISSSGTGYINLPQIKIYTSKSATLSSNNIYLQSEEKVYYNNVEIATVDNVSTSLTEAKAYTDTETTRATTAETTLQTNIDTEITRAKQVEASLQNQIDDKQDTLTAGDGITIEDGTVSVNAATTDSLGVVKPDGTTITISEDGTISGVEQYELPAATTTELGGVKVSIINPQHLDTVPLMINSDSLATVFQNNITYILDDTDGKSYKAATQYIDLKPTYDSDNSTWTFTNLTTAQVIKKNVTVENGYLINGNTSSSYLAQSVGNMIGVEAPLVRTFASSAPYAATLSLAIDNNTIKVNDDGQLYAIAEGSDLTELTERVSSLESELGTTKSELATAQENITTLTNLITDLTTRVTALETLIDGGNA